MAVVEVKNLNFTYPDCVKSALKNINFRVEEGETVLVCGLSGCGKSTLLRCLKPSIMPFYKEFSGEIYFENEPVKNLSQNEQARNIGFVMQKPDNQIVTHKVWHEMAFTMENLGYDKEIMRLKVGEMCSYFGLNHLYERDVNTLSGGQKQLVNLASVLATDPKLIILDEPTAQLDPISAGEFLSVIKRINRELGITVIMSEHHLEEVVSFSDKLLVIDKGSQVFYGDVRDGIKKVSQEKPELFKSMPEGVRLYSRFSEEKDYPLDVCESRSFLKVLTEKRALKTIEAEETENLKESQEAVSCSQLWFKYDKKEKDILKNLSLKVFKGEVFSLLGANGSGKSTLLKCLSGIEKPYRGKIKITTDDKDRKWAAYLPQDPTMLFLKETVKAELEESLHSGKLGFTSEEKKKIAEVIKFFELEELLNMHPYDLSGGEQQKVGLAKLLLKEPEIILLDEPTKGLDFSFKEKLYDTIKKLSLKGKTIIMVSHDIDFAAKCSHRCAMLFNGMILSCDTPREFFGKNRFYTTCASRMARGIIEGAVFTEDIYNALGVNAHEN